MTEFVDVALTDAVRLPYVEGAQSALADTDASFAAAWDALAAAFPGISLDPLFDALPVEDIAAIGTTGIEHIWWDNQGQTGTLHGVANRDHVAQGSTIAVTPTAEKQPAVAAVSPEGRLLAMVGDGGFHLIGGLTFGVPLDPLSRYRRLRGLAIASRTPQTADVVAVDDAGTARWVTGVTEATIGTGFQPGVDDTSGVAFDGGAGVDVSTEGPVAIGVAGERFLALAVNTGGTLLAATRVDGGPWSNQIVGGEATVMPSAGVVAASMADIGVRALVVDIKGSVIASHSRDGADWTPYEDVSE